MTWFHQEAAFRDRQCPCITVAWHDMSQAGGPSPLPWKGLGHVHPPWLLRFLWASRVAWHSVTVPAGAGGRRQRAPTTVRWCWWTAAEGSHHRTLPPGWCSSRFHPCAGAARWGWLNPA